MEAIWGATEWAGACRLVLLAMPSPPDIVASDPPMRLVLCRAQRVLCAGGDPGDKEVLPTAACWLGDQADGFVVRGCRGGRREGWSGTPLPVPRARVVAGQTRSCRAGWRSL